ncbi:Zn-ribbon domain-containing OB-fold protein [Frankia gtarii]|uniref:Zn-ribbon domain-containing OB-fold protein n=1 Tax=Frankia gtarii TaxID=2950102 RepID=UPI0021BEAE42|nr:zinc ribbon domain-containing protein [Frankia gtarii]
MTSSNEVGMEALTEPYYAALRRGELVVQHCKACSRDIMYPRHLCPFCYGDDLSFVPASTRGVLHSFAVHRIGSPTGFENDLPYAVGVVKLADDVQFLARLWPDADGDWGGYACDAEVVFRAADAAEMQRRPVPWFGLPG